MSNITWIKISTNIFDDEKIKLIDAMPDNDAILVIWFKLLVLAGRFNDNGLIRMNNIALNDEMLGAIFNRKVTVVRNALDIFKNFGMIEFEDCIDIVNWEKHQNIDGMDKIKEQNRLRVKNHREKKKQLLLSTNNECNVTSNVTVTQSNAIELDIELEKNKKKNNKNNILPKFQNFESYNQYLESLDKNSNEYYLLLNIQNKYPNIAKLDKQMTFENAKNLINTYSKDDIIEVLNSMENTKGLSKKYISVYLTLNKWLQNHIKFNKGTKNEKIKSDYEKRRSLDLDEVKRNYEKLYGSE